MRHGIVLFPHDRGITPGDVVKVAGFDAFYEGVADRAGRNRRGSQHRRPVPASAGDHRDHPRWQWAPVVTALVLVMLAAVVFADSSPQREVDLVALVGLGASELRAPGSAPGVVEQQVGYLAELAG